MIDLLLFIIYLAFISLGLPDSLLGSAWPVMHTELNASLSWAGIISMIIAAATIVSSLFSDRLTKRFGSGKVTAVSVALTAISLLGFSFAKSFSMLVIIAIPYGLGAGAIDAALNNYVALHYAARHMSWLHCFWGIGASISPYIMSFSLTNGYGWRNGYRSVSIIQFVLAVLFFATLTLWTSRKNEVLPDADSKNNNVGILKALKIKGVKLQLIAFFAYCSIESTSFLWISTYLVEYRNIPKNEAARLASLFYLGITFGRLLMGFFADRISDKNQIRIGSSVILTALALLFLSGNSDMTAFVGLALLGLGCAPIYPAIIHSTPSSFGKENSQSIIGIQMASAYTGSTLMPPIFGLIAEKISVGLYPFYILIFSVLMIVFTEVLNRKLKNV